MEVKAAENLTSNEITFKLLLSKRNSKGERGLLIHNIDKTVWFELSGADIHQLFHTTRLRKEGKDYYVGRIELDGSITFLHPDDTDPEW